MPIDPSITEAAAVLISGGVGATLVSLFRLRPERRKLNAESERTEAERDQAVIDASATAMSMLADALDQIQLLRAELGEARCQVDALVVVNGRLEGEVRYLRERISELEVSRDDA